MQYPIGMITADEAFYAGLATGATNTNNYLYTGQYYWTLSPLQYSGETSMAGVYMIDSGRLQNSWVNSTNGVRPVINLRADVKLSGTGTSSNPYRVS